jgi:hypothetical protein
MRQVLDIWMQFFFGSATLDYKILPVCGGFVSKDCLVYQAIQFSLIGFVVS